MANEVDIELKLRNKQLYDQFLLANKETELQWKKNAIAAKDLNKWIDEQGKLIRSSNIDRVKQVALETQLENLRMRAIAGVKGLNDQLRQMYQEQRLQGRVLGDMRQGVMGLTSALGSSGLGRSISSVITNFDSLESSVRASAIAATNAGGRFAALGSTLTAVAGPASVLAAIGLTIGQNWMAGVTAFETAMARYRKASGEGKAPAPSMRDPFGFGIKLGAPSAALTQFAPWLVGLGLPGYGAELVNQATDRMQSNEDKYGVTVTGTRGGTPQDAARASTVGRGQSGVDLSPYYDRFNQVMGRTGPPTGISAPGARFTAGKLGAVSGGSDGITGVTGEMVKLDAMTRNMIQSLDVGVMSVANSIRTGVGAAWESVFGQANSLLEIFAQNVLSTFAGNFAQSAADWLIGQIPFLSFMAPGGPRGKMAIGSGNQRHKYDNLAKRYTI